MAVAAACNGRPQSFNGHSGIGPSPRKIVLDSVTLERHVLDMLPEVGERWPGQKPGRYVLVILLFIVTPAKAGIQLGNSKFRHART
jgi:hypothetical protein